MADQSSGRDFSRVSPDQSMASNQSAVGFPPRDPPSTNPSMVSQSENNSYPWSPPTTGQYSSNSSAEGPSFTPVFTSHSSIFDKEEGWDLEFVPRRSEKHDCPICLLVLREPVQTECGHRFCRACILRWLRESDTRCPVDNQPLEEKQLFPDNFAKREILALNVKCPNHKLGCDQIVVLKHIQSHLNTCKYSSVSCPNGCSEELLRGKLSEHLQNSCKKRKIKCSMCQNDVIADKQQEHVLDCPMSTMTCPNCEQSLERQKLSTHINTECQRTTVRCQYAVLGCTFEGERQSISEHENSMLAYHMSLINHSLIRLWTLLQQSPVGARARHPSSLNIAPGENPAVGSGALSYPSYFCGNPQNGMPPPVSMLQDIFQQVNMAAEHVQEHLSVSPANSVVTYASPMPLPTHLLQSSPPQDMESGNLGNQAARDQTQSENREQGNNSNRTRSSVLSYTSKPSNRQDQEMPILSLNDTQLLSIKSQNDIQDESLARHDSQLMDLAHQCDYHEKVIRDMKVKIKSLESTIQEFEGRNGNGVFVWKIKNYLKLRCDAEKGETTAIHSGPFYSNFHGYKLCIRVNLNGVDSAKGTHLSLFIHFMQGEFDDLLEWPFNGRIILTVIDQNPICEMRRDISETLLSKPNLAAFQRPTSTRNHKGFGYMEFLPLNVINGSSFIRNDTLIIKATIIPTNS